MPASQLPLSPAQSPGALARGLNSSLICPVIDVPITGIGNYHISQLYKSRVMIPSLPKGIFFRVQLGLSTGTHYSEPLMEAKITESLSALAVFQGLVLMPEEWPPGWQDGTT